MTKLINELSVFFPAYNEEKNIEKTVLDAKKVLEKVAGRWEIIIVNDGSKDKTSLIAHTLAKKDKKIRVIDQENKGYGGALTTGFYNSKYNWIATIDADGQFDFAEITKLYEKAQEGFDLVIGFRINRQDSLLRKINGKGWTFLANILLGINVKDVDCAFKLVSKNVIDKIPQLESLRGGMISPELLAKAKKAGFKITEVPVHHFERKHGKQTGANLKVIFKSFMDLFRLWFKLTF